MKLKIVVLCLLFVGVNSLSLSKAFERNIGYNDDLDYLQKRSNGGNDVCAPLTCLNPGAACPRDSACNPCAATFSSCINNASYIVDPGDAANATCGCFAQLRSCFNNTANFICNYQWSIYVSICPMYFTNYTCAA